MHTSFPPLNEEIGLNTAGLLLGKSVKTMQRWCLEKQIESRVVDLRGKTVVPLSVLLPHTPLTDDDRIWVLQADAGDAHALNELGLIYLAAGKNEMALEWFKEAAIKKHADAMSWLAKYYFAGDMGVEKDEATGLKWLAEAAERGHVIAKAQVDGLLRSKGVGER